MIRGKKIGRSRPYVSVVVLGIRPSREAAAMVPRLSSSASGECFVLAEDQPVILWSW